MSQDKQNGSGSGGNPAANTLRGEEAKSEGEIPGPASQTSVGGWSQRVGRPQIIRKGLWASGGPKSES